MLRIDLDDNNVIDMKYLYYMMNINFYVKSMGSFIILSVMWYKRLTKCYLLHTNLSEFRELGKTCQATCFLYQPWTTGALLNILLGPPNHDSQNSPDKTHELGSWAKNEMLCHELKLWALMRLYSHEFWTMGFGIIFVNMDSFGF